MNIPDVLMDYEICARKAFYRFWRRQKIRPVLALTEAIKSVLTASQCEDGAWGDMAGSKLLELAASPGLDADSATLYACAMNYATLADILVSAIRKPADKAWLIPEPIGKYESPCLMSPEGDKLRRLVVVSNWNDSRHFSECRNWRTMYPMAAYSLPMTLVILIIGNERNGRRHSHWTKALRHVSGHFDVRFRRRVGNTSGGFRDSWTEIWREDHEEISREKWLNGLLKDDVMRDICMTAEMPALPPNQRQHYLDLAERKLEIIEKTKEKPMLQLTGCHFPMPCPFSGVCHSIPEKGPSAALGFVRISGSGCTTHYKP